MSAIDLISWLLLVSGSFFCITGALGIVRFPDFYSRMHAASVTDTMGGGLIIFGLILQADLEALVIVKLIFIFLFLFITSPTASHALAKSAIHSGLKPWQKDNAAQGDQPSNS